MAILSPAAITVATSPALILKSANGHHGTPQSVTMVALAANSTPVLIGGTSGAIVFPIIPGASLSIDLYAGESLWTKVASGTETLNVIYNRV
jgi:hypothetical protein